MKNWLINSIKFDFIPNPENLLVSKVSHYQFCRKKVFITPEIYLENLAVELENECKKLTNIDVKMLTYKVLIKCITNESIRTKILIPLFSKPDYTSKDIELVFNYNEQNVDINNHGTIFIQTYVIATHILFKLESNTEGYYELMKKEVTLRAFIKSNFGVNIEKISNFSKCKEFNIYNIFSKGTDSQKEQYKRHLGQIVENPSIFNEAIRDEAKSILGK